MGGDTIIGSYTYKRFYVGNYFKGGIRENNQTIYYYNADSIMEYVIYDFNLQSGDTVIPPYTEGFALDTVAVWWIDSMLLNDNNYHKAFHMGCAAINIEGVGSIMGPLTPGYGCSVSGGLRLNCFTNDTNLVYTIGAWTGCITGMENKSSEINSVKIFPNPTFDFIKVEKHYSVEKNACYKIRGNTGKIILESKNIPNEINIKNLAKGIYFITFENNGKSETRKFIKN